MFASSCDEEAHSIAEAMHPSAAPMRGANGISSHLLPEYCFHPNESGGQLKAADAARAPFSLHSGFVSRRPSEVEQRLAKLAMRVNDPIASQDEAGALARAYRELWERNDACELAFIRQTLEFNHLK